MLPIEVVQQLEHEADLRLEEEKQIQDALEREAEAKQSQASNKSTRPAYPDYPPPRYVRVIPRIAELPELLSKEASRVKVSDADVLARREKLLARLMDLGPDREFVLPSGDGASIQSLEQQLPNFRAPLRLVANRIALAAALDRPVRVPPILLVGAPGVGKTYFTHRLAEALAVPYSSITFDQPSAGSQLRGSDKYWSNTESGILFNLICLGRAANPVVLLDEIDKSARIKVGRDLDPLAQLHGALEPQTSTRIVDISTEVEFDASMVTYIATANTIDDISPSILSRFEIFHIHSPTPSERLDLAARLAERALTRWDLRNLIVEEQALIVLSALTPRVIQRTLESAIAEAIVGKNNSIGEKAIWQALGLDGVNETMH